MIGIKPHNGHSSKSLLVELGTVGSPPIKFCVTPQRAKEDYIIRINDVISGQEIDKEFQGMLKISAQHFNANVQASSPPNNNPANLVNISESSDGFSITSQSLRRLCDVISECKRDGGLFADQPQKNASELQSAIQKLLRERSVSAA